MFEVKTWQDAHLGKVRMCFDGKVLAVEFEGDAYSVEVRPCAEPDATTVSDVLNDYGYWGEAGQVQGLACSVDHDLLFWDGDWFRTLY